MLSAFLLPFPIKNFPSFSDKGSRGLYDKFYVNAVRGPSWLICEYIQMNKSLTMFRVEHSNCLLKDWL